MARDRILQKVEEIEQTLEQPIQTDQDRDHILHQARTQIKELQNALQNGAWGSAAQISDGKGTGQLDATANGHQTLQPKENFLENWKVCECSHTDCPTCRAEWEAINSAKTWARTHNQTDPYGHYPCQNDGQVWDKVMAEGVDLGTYGSPLCGQKEIVNDIVHAHSSSDSTSQHKNMDKFTKDTEMCLQEEKEVDSYSYCRLDDEMFNASASELNEINPTSYMVDMEPEPVLNEWSRNRYFDPENVDKSATDTCDEKQLLPEDQTTVAHVDGTQESGGETQLILKSPRKKGMNQEKVMLTVDGSGLDNGEMRVTNAFRCKVVNLREVTCLVEPSYTETGEMSMCLICLQPMFSTSTYAEMDAPTACGVVALLFAEKMVKVPHTELLSVKEHQDHLNNDTMTMVAASLGEGIDTYTSNYGYKDQMLGVEDIILLNSHLDVHLKNEKSVGYLVAETFVDSLVNLKVGEILLLLRWQNYKVLSAMRGQVNDDIVIFDCQPHKVADPGSDEEVEHGAFIYHIIQRDIETVRRAIKILENYSGQLHGECVLVVTDT